MVLLAWLVLTCACGEPSAVDAGPADAAPAFDAFVPPPSCEELPEVAPPACGSGTSDGRLLPGPTAAAHDATLAAKARAFDRGFHALHAPYTGVNAELTVADPADRELVRRFFAEHDGWDFEAFAGQSVPDTVDGWQKVAGAYAGAGVTADAFRYATLRDQGAACVEVDRAREQLRSGLDALHRAHAITGGRGVVARGYMRSDRPGAVPETVPLFDAAGDPLPEPKNNGTWREDNSVDGAYPEFVWEDSCSRDMLIGWVWGMASAWEVIARDPTFDDALRERLREDANAIARSLMRVGEDGYDLEIHDADGRLTFHAYLHENAIDRVYVPGRPQNGLHAVMSLGIVAALARIGDAEDVGRYLHEELVRARGLPALVREKIDFIDFGVQTNFSNYNMAFTGAWLAHRYLCDGEARADVAAGTDTLYGERGDRRQPVEQGQSFYDLVTLAARGSATAASPLRSVDDAALEGALGTLRGWPEAPYWDAARENCDAAEIAALACVAEDGSDIVLLDELGRNDLLVARDPVPMGTRPPSNYFWRSDPYSVNGGSDSGRLLPSPDFRVAYWMGRYLRTE